MTRKIPWLDAQLEEPHDLSLSVASSPPSGGDTVELKKPQDLSAWPSLAMMNPMGDEVLKECRKTLRAAKLKHIEGVALMTPDDVRRWLPTTRCTGATKCCRRFPVEGALMVSSNEAITVGTADNCRRIARIPCPFTYTSALTPWATLGINSVLTSVEGADARNCAVLGREHRALHCDADDGPSEAEDKGRLYRR
jgi:hypothetical protein